MGRALNASRVTWIAAYRGSYGRRAWLTELLDGWKVLDLVAFPEAERGERTPQEAFYRRARSRGLDDLTAHALSRSGMNRTHRLSADIESSDGGDWPVQNRDGEFLLADRMLCVVHLADEAESYLVLDRPIDALPFSSREASTALALIAKFPRLHHWLFLERGLIAPATRPFSPRQREIVRYMLVPLSEKEIAAKTGLSQGSVHGYAMDVYRNLGVGSRAEMMGLWLGEVGVPEPIP